VSVLPRDYDQLWVLGDLVNYGPNPREIIEFVRQRATYVIRGNHDHAMGFNADPRCSGPYKAMAAEMGAFAQRALAESDKAYFAFSALSLTTEWFGTRFYLCHASPSDPLFAYRPPDSADWENEVQTVPTGYLLVGHTHLQFRHDISNRVILNPGSVGQPKTGAPEACSAIWEDGTIQFHSAPYAYRKTIEKIRHLDLSKPVEEGLITTLESGNPVSTTVL
jgi:predicted phosphodiesterase